MQNSAIQLVPSLCSSWPPSGSGLSRSNTPMLSMPKKPPPNTSRPLAVLAIDPEAEVEHLVLEDFLEELHVAPAGLLAISI